MKTADKTAKKQTTEKPRSKGKLGQILGHSVVSVVRSMGKAGWDYEAARAALDQLKIKAKEHTVRMALKRGRDHDKTRKIAPLTKAQLGSLRVTPKAKA